MAESVPAPPARPQLAASVLPTVQVTGTGMLLVTPTEATVPNELQALALTLAGRDAQTRAMALAQQFGLQLTSVRSMSMLAPAPLPMAFAAAFPGTLPITAQVSVEYTAVQR